MSHLLLASGFGLDDFFHPLRYWGYQFWSGIGSDFSEVTLLGIVLGTFRHVNCQTPWCLRFGRHQTADGHHVCRKHHPEMPNGRASLEEIHQRHYAAKQLEDRRDNGSRAAEQEDAPASGPPVLTLVRTDPPPDDDPDR